MGESGSGKTLTALSLLRLVADAQISGSALFAGVGGATGAKSDLGAEAGDVAPAGPPDNRCDLLALPERQLRAIRGRDIAMVFQEPMTALNPLFTIGQQIAEILQLKEGLAQAQSAQAAIDLIAATGIAEPARRARAFPHQLSGGQRQRAVIAMALACKPRLLLADEPTTALDVTVRGQILDLLASLQRSHGMAVLLITHDLHLVRRFADRVAVMERGHIVEEGAVEDVLRTPRHAYTRRLLDSIPRRDPQPLPALAKAPLLTARALQVRYAIPRGGWRGWFGKDAFVAVQGADFRIQPGRTLGIVGESGSGKSTLAQAVLGLLPHVGELRFAIGVAHHHDVAGVAGVAGVAHGDAAPIGWNGRARADRALRREVQAVFQDPFSSLSPRMTIGEIVAEGLRVHRPQMQATEREAAARARLAEVGLTEDEFPGLLERYPHAFSGGQRQRIAIARALIVEPALLVLDEPTSALDVTIQMQVLTLLQRLQRERGLAYMLITHDMDVIRAMAHDVLAMRDGMVVEAGSCEEVLNRPQHSYTRALIDAAGTAARPELFDQFAAPGGEASLPLLPFPGAEPGHAQPPPHGHPADGTVPGHV